MKSIRPILTLLIIAFSFQIKAQINPELELQKVIQKSDLVENFTANVEIDVDVDFIKIPVKEGEIFYQAPDLYDFESKGFTLLPKKGMDFNLQTLLNSNYAALYAGADSIYETIKIIPMDDKTEFLLATLWIDTTNARIEKLNLATKDEGSFILHFYYTNASYNLPDSTIIEFEIEPLNLPTKLLEDMKMDSKITTQKTQGKVVLHYSDYQVNIEMDHKFKTRKKEKD